MFFESFQFAQVLVLGLKLLMIKAKFSYCLHSVLVEGHRRKYEVALRWLIKDQLQIELWKDSLRKSSFKLRIDLKGVVYAK